MASRFSLLGSLTAATTVVLATACSSTDYKQVECTAATAALDCTKPPADECSASSNARVTYPAVGTCSDRGECVYSPREVICNAPPKPACRDARTSITYPALGTCAEGQCTYAPTEVACAPQTCTNGSVTLAASCDSAKGTCVTPPAARCPFNAPCSGAYCAGDPCAANPCNTPPAAVCVPAAASVPAKVRTFAPTATCTSANGTAQCGEYPATDTPCTKPPVCVDSVRLQTFAGACPSTSGVARCEYTSTITNCSVPKAPECANGTTVRRFENGGCTGGACSYTQTDTACAANNVCQSGVCSPCPSGATVVNGACACPSGTTLVSGACKCSSPAGSELVSGACVCTSGATDVSGTCTWKWTGTTVGALNATSSFCGGSNAGESSYQWTAPFTGPVTVTVTGDWDQVLYIRNGTFGGTVACANNSGLWGSETISFNAVQGTTYVLYVDGYGTQSGSFTLTLKRS